VHRNVCDQQSTKEIVTGFKEPTSDICVVQSSIDILHTKDPRLQRIFEASLECQRSVLNSPNV